VPGILASQGTVAACPPPQCRYVGGEECLNVLESPSLETFRTRLDAVLCSLLWVTLLRQEVGLGDPQRSLPTPAMLGFCDKCLLKPDLASDAPANVGQ